MRRRTGPRTELLEPRLVLSAPRLHPALLPVDAGDGSSEVPAASELPPEEDAAAGSVIEEPAGDALPGGGTVSFADEPVVDVLSGSDSAAGVTEAVDRGVTVADPAVVVSADAVGVRGSVAADNAATVDLQPFDGTVSTTGSVEPAAVPLDSAVAVRRAVVTVDAGDAVADGDSDASSGGGRVAGDALDDVSARDVGSASVRDAAESDVSAAADGESSDDSDDRESAQTDTSQRLAGGSLLQHVDGRVRLGGQESPQRLLARQSAASSVVSRGYVTASQQSGEVADAADETWLDSLTEFVSSWVSPVEGVLFGDGADSSSVPLLAAGGAIPLLALARKSSAESERSESNATSEFCGVQDRKWWKERRRGRTTTKSRRAGQRRLHPDHRLAETVAAGDSLDMPDISEAFAMSVMTPVNSAAFAMTPLTPASDPDAADSGERIAAVGLGTGAAVATVTAAGIAQHCRKQRKPAAARPVISYSGTTREFPE